MDCVWTTKAAASVGAKALDWLHHMGHVVS